MVKLFRYIICFASILLAIVGCKRQPICSIDSQINSAKISFSIDWSDSNIEVDDISNVSVYAYAEEAESPYLNVSGDIYSTYINLPEGSYSLLVFNDFVGDIVGVSFSDVESFDSFSASVVELTTTDDLYYQVQSDEVAVQAVGAMAAWRLEEFEVSEDMVWCSYCEDVDISSEVTLVVEVEALTTTCTVEVAIDNLDNAAYVEATIKGLASGIYLSDGSRFSGSDLAPIFSMELDDSTYSSSSDGVIRGEINTFGKVEEDDTLIYEVEINIILNSGVLVTYNYDVTTQLLDQDNVAIFIDLTDDDYVITLPESSDSGFGVDNWGDNEQIDLL